MLLLLLPLLLLLSSLLSSFLLLLLRQNQSPPDLLSVQRPRVAKQKAMKEELNELAHNKARLLTKLFFA